MALESLNSEFLGSVWVNDVNAKIEEWATRGKLSKLVGSSGYNLKMDDQLISNGDETTLNNGEDITIIKKGTSNAYTYKLVATAKTLKATGGTSTTVANNDNNDNNQSETEILAEDIGYSNPNWSGINNVKDALNYLYAIYNN